MIFYRNRDWLKDLSDKAEVIHYWYREKGRKKVYEVGIIAVIHTFGRDLKFNPHVHVLVTEGAIDKNSVRVFEENLAEGIAGLAETEISGKHKS
ncbi:transposase [Carboxydocella sp. ULO1]|uniref:transposase n=1 Tax=Carboxydocella sp. ULO1 TaxID=1926599 RepID=UPI0013564C67|nr:transposase [Carboxydocella sp. ULO1]